MSRMTAVARYTWSAAGVVCVGLGFAGAVLPVLPTTPFLLLAGGCFAKGNPELGARLLSHRLFKPYRPFLDGTKPIPERVRWATIGIVWVIVGTSIWFLVNGGAPTWQIALLAAAAVTGNIVVLRIRRS